jgi:hypothetical protein
MKQILYWPVIFLLAAILPRTTHAQQQLHLDYNCRNPASAFSNVEVIDNRPPNALLGYVQKGAFNRLEPVSFNGSLVDSLALFFKAGNAVHKEDKTLVLILNELFMSEKTSAMSEAGTLRLSLRLYQQTSGDQYAELLTLDSIYSFTGLDVTKRLLRTVSGELCWLSGKMNGYKPNESRSYSLEQLHHVDSLEMLDLPAFTQPPVSGIYKDYEHFKNNQPDIPVTIVADDSHPKHIHLFKVSVRKNGKETKSETLGGPIIYAVSDGVRSFRFVDGSYYEIKQSELGFYYDRPAAFSNNGAMWGAVIGGIPGAIIGANITKQGTHTYRFKINGRTGRSSPVLMLD